MHLGDSVNLCKLVLSLCGDAELFQSYLGMRDDRTNQPLILPEIEGESGAERQLYALDFQMLLLLFFLV